MIIDEMDNKGMNDMKTYPIYKDSGVPCLGDVPKHWMIRRTKYILKETDNRSIDGKEQLLSVSQYTGVMPRRNKENSDVADTRANSLVGYKVVKENDLVINIMLAWNGSLGVSSYSGIVSPAYCIYRFAEIIFPKFYHYLYKTDLYKTTFKTYSTGVIESRLRLYSDKLGRIESIIPPLEEQHHIARYLDWQTSRINTFIKAKKKLIALLKEQKQVIINEAVTKGINPDVKMKDSGVEWLGEIPEHWECSSLRHKYNQCLGKMLDSKKITGTHLIPYLRNTDIQWDRINTKSLPKMDIRPEEYERYTVQSGDLLVCEGGEVGRCAIWTDNSSICGYQKALHRLRPINKTKDIPRFMYYALNAAAMSGAFNDGHVSTIAHLTGDKLRAHRFAFPPPKEQKEIVDLLDHETTLIDQTIVRTEREIDLIREYRTRLVSDVVTGKIDVRSIKIPDFDPVEEAADEPDDTLSDEPMDEEETP